MKVHKKSRFVVIENMLYNIDFAIRALFKSIDFIM